MDSLAGEHSSAAAYWRKSVTSVPGRPKREDHKPRHRNTSSCTSFEDFEESVQDAWDIKDDSFGPISNKVAHTAAIDVINRHRSTVTDALPDSSISDETDQSESRRAEGMLRLASQRLAATDIVPPPVVVNTVLKSPYRITRHPHLIPTKSTTQHEESQREISKRVKFEQILNNPNAEMADIQNLSWSGIPVSVRASAWRLLSGYVPLNLSRRQESLDRKRQEYWNCVTQHFGEGVDEAFKDMYRQICIDIPRMSPLIKLFQQRTVQTMFERILFIWAVRHPASGYVQGINDLVTPFYVVFLQDLLPPDAELDHVDIATLPKDDREILEADSFWCFSYFLECIQDNYIFAQPGIQEKVNQLKDLTHRVDGPLHLHLVKHEVDYLQFSFRWMNNLLMRELPLRCSIRLWDTYLSESKGFAKFHLYVCAAFLIHWRGTLLRQNAFQDLMLLLQNLPSKNWGSKEIDVLVAEAHQLRYLFSDAPKHLENNQR